MDGLSENQTEVQPTVQVVQKNFFQTRKGLVIIATFAAVLIFSILAFSLNPPLKITLSENYGFKVGQLTLSCPVEAAFCPSQRLISINKTDAISYKAASGSAVLDLAQVPNLENIAVLTNREKDKKYFYESVISNDSKSCYTIAYTLPSDTEFANILHLESFLKEKKVATLGSDIFEAEGEEANVLIQVRNTPMDPGTPCSLIKKSPEFFKEFN